MITGDDFKVEASFSWESVERPGDTPVLTIHVTLPDGERRDWQFSPGQTRWIVNSLSKYRE